MRPRCCLRYLTFFGINMIDSPYLCPPRRSARRAVSVLFVATDARHEALTLVEPHLHANLPVGRVRFREAVVDVGAQRLQRKLSVQVPLGARDFCAVQPTGHTHLDPARAEAQRRFNRLAHRTAEGDALLELHRHRFGDQLRLQLRLLDLLDIDEDLPAGALLDLLLQLVDFRPLAADDDAGARGVDVDLQVVRRAFGFNARHTGMREALLQILTERQVLVQQLRVVLPREPARAPGLVEAEPESVRVNLLAHVSLLFLYALAFAAFASAFFVAVFRARAGVAAAASASALTRAIFSGRSATRTVRCALRLTTR